MLFDFIDDQFCLCFFFFFFNDTATTEIYTLSLHDALPIWINASVTFTGLTPGSHSVVLSGVAANCTVSGGTSRTVSVTAGSTASTSYSVSCAPTSPGTGSLTVTTATSGASGDLDPDGYTVSVDGGAASQPIATNGSVTFTGPAGDHSIRSEEHTAELHSRLPLARPLPL